MIKNEHIVLLGSAGVGTAYASAKALRKFYNVRIISVDTNPSILVTTNLLSDNFFQVIPVDKIEFGDVISGIINDQKIDTYIPFIDNEIYKAALLFENEKINKNIFLQVKDSSVAKLCMDKFETFNWLKLNGFPTPETLLVDENKNLKQGYILKPRSGYGSKIQEIKKDCCLIFENHDDLIMQEHCQLPEVTIDVHYSCKYDYFAYCCRERLETKSGVCTKAKIFRDSYLGEMALKLAKKLGLSSFCFQVMTLKNEYVITDINPRLGAGTAMCSAVGLDFHGAMFANLWGENPEKFFINKLTKENYVTRQFCEFVM